MHVDGNHFVTIIDYSDHSIFVRDPFYKNLNSIEWLDCDLMARWDGVILVISKPKDGTIPSVAAQKAAPKTTDAR